MRPKIGDSFLEVDGLDEFQEEVISDPIRAMEIVNDLQKMILTALSLETVVRMDHREIYIRFGVRDKQIRGVNEAK